jgi:hypothetical protein
MTSVSGPFSSLETRVKSRGTQISSCQEVFQSQKGKLAPSGTLLSAAWEFTVLGYFKVSQCTRLSPCHPGWFPGTQGGSGSQRLLLA